MNTFDIQGIEIQAPRNQVFEFLRDPRNLPRWAHAFKTVDDGRAQLQTPTGVVDVQLHTSVQATAGTIDRRLEFPDGTVGLSQSRVTETSRGTCIYSFVLHAPPVSLERVEGTLETQRVSLRSELLALKRLMEI
jgi:uncharacterized protein YndB with AHSA1/START domain